MTTRSNNYGTALITETSSGIGLELALEFGACAARLPVGTSAPEIQGPNVIKGATMALSIAFCWPVE